MLQGITKENVMYEKFIKAIEAEGLTPPAEIIADGKMHRFDSDNSGKKNGSYVYHADEPQSGWFKCWKIGVENTWCSGYTETDPEKIEQYQKHIKQRTQENAAQVLVLNKKAAIKAAIEYQDAKSADPDHPYLIRKQIKPVKGLKQDPTTGDLIVPIYCKDGNIISRQTINEDGDKYFLKDGQTKGGYLDLGESIETIVICEGFATGASIYEATGYRVRCAFNCGNLKEVAKITRDEYPKSTIIIAADDDHQTEGNPGQTKAKEAALSIKTTLVVSPYFGETRPVKATDFNDLHCLNGVEAVRMIFEDNLKPLVDSENCTELDQKDNHHISEQNVWQKPEEIITELLPVTSLIDDLIPEPFRAWITDISKRMQCPLDYPFATVIVMCSSIIGTCCSIRPKSKDSWQVVPNLWGGLVGSPSALKTPAIQEVTRTLTDLENKKFDETELEQKQYQRELRSWEIKKGALEDDLKKAYKSKKSDSVDLQDVESRLNKHEDNPPKEPIPRRYSTSDSTIPKLQELMSSNPQGILVLRDELQGFLASMEQEGRETDRAFHLEAWSGQGSFILDRIGRGTIRSKLICESVFGSIQPAKIIPHIRQTLNGSGNDGLLQRFQVLVYPDDKIWSYIDQLPDKDSEKRVLKLLHKLEKMDFVKDAGAILDNGDTIPYLRFSPEGQELFRSWITDLEVRLRNNDELPAIQEHLGKYRSLMPSLALIHHLLGVADGIASGPVSLKSAKLAAATCDYLESHARRIYHMAGDINQRAAGNLSMRITQRKINDGFTARDVYRKGWSLLTEKDVVKAALCELEESNWLKRKKLPPQKGGKIKVVYDINPEVYNFSNT
jgi:putative DNA primase/helicase